MNDSIAEHLLAVPEENEADDDVAGNDVKIAKEFRQDSRDVGKRTLKRKKLFLSFSVSCFIFFEWVIVHFGSSQTN